MMNNKLYALCLLLVLAISPIPRGFAQPAIPAALEPWRDWVLYGQEFRSCPVLNGQNPGQSSSHICAWPGLLEFDAGAESAEFAQNWSLYRDGWVPLPGNSRYWPVAVTVDGSASAVVLRDGRPTVRVPAGEHQIQGRLAWSTRPASIPVPRETGLVSLSLDGTRIAVPEIDNGELWFGLRPELVLDEDRLTVEVYRVLSDTIPGRLLTRIELDVAGQSREVELTGAMLPAFVGESLNSDLPAALTADGTLRMQIRPGRWSATLIAHTPGTFSDVTRVPVVEPWPTEEIWSFESIPQLRVAILEGAPAVDSERAGVPSEWRDLPSFAVSAGDQLTITERSRNDATGDNRLSLSRYLWLDFDGNGFTAEDRVTGQLASDWRLDMSAPYVMTMAAIDASNLLVTEGADNRTQGVELRSPVLNLTTTSRMPFSMSLPVTGYTQAFDGARTELVLPPAHRLLAAPGADTAAGTWIERWSLLDMFLALIIGVASWRLLGAVGGLTALAAIVLTYHEPAAPHYAWLNLLLITALVRVVPAGRIRHWCTRYRYLSIAALVLVLVPFVALQLRVVLFPQLEQNRLDRDLEPYAISSAELAQFGMSVANVRGMNTATGTRTLTMVDSRRMTPSEEAAAIDMNFIPSVVVGSSETVTGGASATYGADAMAGVVNVVLDQEPQSRYQPGALVQTGPGLPDWGWNLYTLEFAGPIEPEQTFSLIIIGPWLLGLWRVAGIALALAFAGLLLTNRIAGGSNALRRKASGAAGITGAAIVAGLVAGALPPAAQAQTPDNFPPLQLLEELRTRLTTPAPCHPGCAELAGAHVEIDATTLTIDLDFAIQDHVAVPLPGSENGFSPASITVDDRIQTRLLRDIRGQAWLELEPGVRRVSLSGPIPAGDSLGLPFPLPPRHIDVTATGWDVIGVADGRLLSGTLELIRQRQAEGDDGDTIQATAFPPYVRINRTFSFNLDWIVTTSVRRVAPRDGAFTIDIDLLPDESVITDDIDVEDGVATIAFAPGRNQVTWQSRLPVTASLTLNARDDAPWTEEWNFNSGYQWHAEFEGLPAAQSAGTIAYLPRPGETLEVDITRPEPVSGDTIAVDDLEYTRSMGDRTSVSDIEFTYRSTRAGEQVIQLPPGSALESVQIDRVVVPLELSAQMLTLPITPGEHDIRISLRSPDGVAMRTNLPPIDLGAGISNMTLQLRLPADRWVLMAYGPTLGPAILYWAELAVFVIAAILLGKIALSPLRSSEWLLLGLGLSTFSWPVLFLFGAWAFLMSLRAIKPFGGHRYVFNTIQVALGGLTVIMLVTLISSIENGLLGEPNMHIISPVTRGDQLSWFMDRSAGTTPVAGVISVSLWFYKAAMLAWALWLSFAVLRWLRWAWTAISTGSVWRGKVSSTA